MTDKNMINGINVSNCKYFNNGWCLLSESCDVIKYKPCGDMTLFDCYYKQLKRKEQALDKLIPILEYYATSTIGLKQVDGTYKFVYGANNFGDELCLNYDPRLAIEGLNIINKAKEIKR